MQNLARKVLRTHHPHSDSQFRIVLAISLGRSDKGFCLKQLHGSNWKPLVR